VAGCQGIDQLPLMLPLLTGRRRTDAANVLPQLHILLLLTPMVRCRCVWVELLSGGIDMDDGFGQV
jgi:hypothetical protein